jgi:hypothetical protein
MYVSLSKNRTEQSRRRGKTSEKASSEMPWNKFVYFPTSSVYLSVDTNYHSYCTYLHMYQCA